jgi:hypothetical protein
MGKLLNDHQQVFTGAAAVLSSIATIRPPDTAHCHTEPM